ncbi:radical SAM protein [Candidatus Shapirobacteria bacterium]|nr:radical SAM protein [Candidatus Shapirobacteria bacterium]
MASSKEITLISPPTTTHRTPEECLGLEYLAAESIEHGHRVDYLDAWMSGLDLKQTGQRVLEKKPDVVGISPSMDSFPIVTELVSFLRSQQYEGQIVLGGIYASFEADSLLAAIGPQIDGILAGEADETFQKFLQAGNIRDVPGAIYWQKGRIIRNPRQEVDDNLDLLPLPHRETLPLVRKLKTPSHVMGSRGCRGNCSFCSVACYQKFSTEKRWRGRSPESIVAELVDLSKRGEDMVKLVDDNFFGQRVDKQRELRFAQLLKNSGINMRFRISLRVDDVENELIELLKQAGLFAVSLGVESFVQKKLNDFAKGTTVEQNIKALEILSKHGIYVQMGHIMFWPFTTMAEVEEELHYLKRFKWAVTKGICTKLFAADGTRITKRLHREVGFIGKEGANNLYEIIDPQARNFYYALRSWAKELAPLYEQVIDPISAPKNVSPQMHARFHELYMILKNMDLEVSERLTQHASDPTKLQDVLEKSRREFSGSLALVKNQTDHLYNQVGLSTSQYQNGRI